jgi:hypothetical protein
LGFIVEFCFFPASPNFTLFEGASGDLIIASSGVNDVVHEPGADYSTRALIRAIAVLSQATPN